MVSTQEIVERSFYMALLTVALSNHLTLDPDDYLDSEGVTTKELESQFVKDKAKLDKFIYIFGVGNNQSRGPKLVPRITLETQGYYPGILGTERYAIDKVDNEQFHKIDYGDYLIKSTTIDVRLVANTQSDMRLLHSIMYAALPSKGYIKPFINNKEEYLTPLSPTDNIFINIGNYYEHRDNEHGLLEKVYSYSVEDGIIPENIGVELVPIKDISLILKSDSETEVHIP